MKPLLKNFPLLLAAAFLILGRADSFADNEGSGSLEESKGTLYITPLGDYPINYPNPLTIKWNTNDAGNDRIEVYQMDGPAKLIHTEMTSSKTGSFNFKPSQPGQLKFMFVRYTSLEQTTLAQADVTVTP